VRWLQQLKSGRHDADDGVWPRIEIDRFANGVRRTAVLSLPESVAQHGNRRCARAIFVSTERAAYVSVNAEQWKNRRRHHARIEALRFAGARERDRRAARCFQRFKRRALCAPIDVILIRGADDRERALLGDEDEARRILVRKWTQ